MDAKDILYTIFSFLFPLILATRGIKKKSLSVSGAIAAFFVGSITLLYGFRYGATLIAFYISSSRLTKYKSNLKNQFEESFKEGGQRNWLQVFASSILGAAICLFLWPITKGKDCFFDSQNQPLVTALMSAYVAHFACCNGDTWASEIGILSQSEPYLITTFRKVPRGTNGGISSLGTAASAAGGGFIGLCFVLFGLLTSSVCGPDGIEQEVSKLDIFVISPGVLGLFLKQFWIIPLGILAGFFGSVMDSILGAFLQFSGYCTVRKKIVCLPGPTVKRITGFNILNNEAVNFFSALITMVFAFLFSSYLF